MNLETTLLLSAHKALEEVSAPKTRTITCVVCGEEKEFSEADGGITDDDLADYRSGGFHHEWICGDSKCDYATLTDEERSALRFMEEMW